MDEVRIRQILLNLVGNAIKFTEDGHVTLSLRAAPNNENSVDLTITVEDTGIGIPEAEQEKIFRSFEQQSDQDSAKYGGTGLGTSISKRLVEAMGGEIWVESEPGKGSIFHFTCQLPFADDCT